MSPAHASRRHPKADSRWPPMHGNGSDLLFPAGVSRGIEAPAPAAQLWQSARMRAMAASIAWMPWALFSD